MAEIQLTEQEQRILTLVEGSLTRAFTESEAESLKLNVKASCSSVKGRIGTDESFFEDNFIYELAVSQQAVNNFMNRSAATDVNLYRTEYGFQDYILQLKADYAVTHPLGGDDNGTA